MCAAKSAVLALPLLPAPLMIAALPSAAA